MRSTGHIRQRSQGSYELHYPLGTDLATGKRKTVTTTVRGNRRAAEKELRRLYVSSWISDRAKRADEEKWK